MLDEGELTAELSKDVKRLSLILRTMSPSELECCWWLWREWCADEEAGAALSALALRQPGVLRRSDRLWLSSERLALVSAAPPPALAPPSAPPGPALPSRSRMLAASLGSLYLNE